MKKIFLSVILTTNIVYCSAQLKWTKVDSLFGPLPSTVHVYKTTDWLDGKPNTAYYVEASLNDKNLVFDADTTLKRRLKPSEYYERNGKALVVVNTTFFSFATNQNLNVVIDEGRLVGYNIHDIVGRGKDTLTYRHVMGSAIGITKERKADIAWLYTDSSMKMPQAMQFSLKPIKDSVGKHDHAFYKQMTSEVVGHSGEVTKNLKEWKMQTAVGGGPVLVQEGKINITNDEELKFAGKAVNDKHPRTAMGYTKDNKVIVLVIEGRNPGVAEGASLTQEAQMLKDIGCWEALNLDGGGSSCMLVNGKETIKVSDPTGQRPVPAVFLIKKK